MVDIGPTGGYGRARVGWWAFVLILAGAAAFIAHSFVGILVLGVFGYYATRPICRRLATYVDSDSLAAGLTVTLVLLPVVLVLFYAGFQLLQQAQQLLGGGAGIPLLGEHLGALSDEQRRTLRTALENPSQLVTNPRQTFQRVLEAGLAATSVVAGALLLLSLSVTLSFFLLKNDDALSDGLRQLFGGRDTTAHAYASAVDGDLESVFFGNMLFVATMAVVATAVYWGTNLVAPEGIAVPMVLVLGFLTGVASLIPIVVGKVVYLPVVGYLGLQAMGSGGGFAFVGGVLVVYFLVLDILPQTFLQPYITGRQIDPMILLFGYILGPILFGWYGFFLMPIVFVVILEAVRIVLPELVRGERLTPTVSMGESVGASLSSSGEPTNDDGSSEEDVSGGQTEEERAGDAA
ncbi:AI-2E family transporter [Halorarum halophilum]|uniref:AI-2E family transporter n=1 Tax=Halorarum halophilum TaxID=2743090 RepID=A0A7D5GK26_9EURY|nr:AI-2E family transporter [Halobaculum halophilum]QLG26967.1 AI-2E family transporter [Halobaculum halophilum]